MRQFELLEHLKAEIQKSSHDIKPEPQLLQAVDRGLQYEDFLVCPDQLFRREHSRDISAVEVKDVRNQEVLNVHLSRSGLFDQLPEGLFFQMPQRNKRLITVADMATDYKENKKQEEEIRRFFLPFEHDFFLQRMSLDAEEVALLNGVQSGMLTDYFNDFWNLSENIPAGFISTFILLLSHASKISGNFPLTAYSLQQVLKEQVNIRVRSTGITHVDASVAATSLGETQLGLDMVCGNNFWEGEPEAVIEIGPLVHSQVKDYLQGAVLDRLLKTFVDFFMPAGMDAKVVVLLPAEQLHLGLTVSNEPVLGYSSVLG